MSECCSSISLSSRLFRSIPADREPTPKGRIGQKKLLATAVREASHSVAVAATKPTRAKASVSVKPLGLMSRSRFKEASERNFDGHEYQRVVAEEAREEEEEVVVEEDEEEIVREAESTDGEEKEEVTEETKDESVDDEGRKHPFCRYFNRQRLLCKFSFITTNFVDRNESLTDSSRRGECWLYKI